jgi:hypothetical protein
MPFLYLHPADNVRLLVLVQAFCLAIACVTLHTLLWISSCSSPAIVPTIRYSGTIGAFKPRRLLQLAMLGSRKTL